MENDNKVDIEMADMIGKTYFKIATWYNEDFGTEGERAEGLKHVCAEVIQQVLEDTFMQIQGLGGTGVKTIKNDQPEDNSTPGKGGRMFSVNEDAITRAMREQKEE